MYSATRAAKAATTSLLLSAACWLLPATSASAQIGAVLDGPVILARVTGGDAFHGIAFGPGADPANPGTLARGFLWVSGSATVGGSRAHFLYQIDVHASGGPTLVASHPAPPSVTPSSSGLLDLAYEEVRHLLLAGTDEPTTPRTLFAFDCLGLSWDPASQITSATSQINSFHAVAVAPGGQRLWVADSVPGSAIEELDATGRVIRRMPGASHGSERIHGLGYSPGLSGVLLAFGRGGSSATASGLPGSKVVLRTYLVSSYWYGLPANMTFADTSLPPASAVDPSGGLAGGMDWNIDDFYGPGARVAWCLQRGAYDAAIPVDYGLFFGQRCSPAGNPDLAGDAPYRGNRDFRPRLYNVNGVPRADLFLGLSKTTWNGHPLPFDLSPLGLLGCSLWISPDVFAGSGTPFPFTWGGASTTAIDVAVPIPLDPALADATIYCQWVVSRPQHQPPFRLTEGIQFVIK